MFGKVEAEVILTPSINFISLFLLLEEIFESKERRKREENKRS